MDLYYDERDDPALEARGSRILYWLDDLGAKPLAEARPADPGFLFARARPLHDYARLVARLPLVRDQPAERAPPLRLDSTLDALAAAGVGGGDRPVRADAVGTPRSPSLHTTRAGGWFA
jgi:hypothetical protein